MRVIIGDMEASRGRMSELAGWYGTRRRRVWA
jgi:hypothetical protein